MQAKTISDLVDKAVASDSAEARDAKTELQTALGLDDLNLEYFLALYSAFKGAKTAEPIQIHEHGSAAGGKQIAYPTAIASPDMMRHLPYVDYAAIAGQGYAARARQASLWLKKMQAGSGSSLTRTTYLSRILGISPEKVRIGAKGTDLYADVADPAHAGKTASVSLAEMQILQSIHDAREGIFGEVILQDIVSSETEESLEAIWEKRSLTDASKKYIDLANNMKGFRKFGRSFQRYIPTIDEKGKVSMNRTAPGGHALFAVDALRAAYLENRRPTHFEGSTLIAAIGNGEDLSSTPDAAMVGWMLAERIPIAMVTTEKTENDLKGGQIALVQRPDGAVYATIIEQAQAKEAGQLKLFEQLGLRRGDAMAFFNTNMALFNYSVLVPALTRLVQEIGEREFMNVIAPDLIENKKSQRDKDGVTRTYTQLEGAMGSSLLRLDRFWRSKYGTPLVHFINVDRNNRTKFFSPIKTAFDYFMQFHSDRFEIDPREMRLINKRPGSLPAVTLTDKESDDKYYADVENILHTFAGASIRDLDILAVNGRVGLRNTVLRGSVRIDNVSGQELDVARRMQSHEVAAKARTENSRLVLEDIEIDA